MSHVSVIVSNYIVHMPPQASLEGLLHLVSGPTEVRRHIRENRPVWPL